MGVAKAILLEPLEERAHRPTGRHHYRRWHSRHDRCPEPGPAGFCRDAGRARTELGGLLRHLFKLYPRSQTPGAGREYITEVNSHPHIEVFTSAEVREIRGFIGNFELLSTATPGDGPTPTGWGHRCRHWRRRAQASGVYGYGDDARIITQLELEQLLAAPPPVLQSPSPSPTPTVVMIQCVGARDDKRTYCGRTAASPP